MEVRPTQSRKGVKGRRPLWGLGQRPNSSTGDQYAKRAQQRCRQRSAPASNSARPQTRLQAALPPRFREEPFFFLQLYASHRYNSSIRKGVPPLTLSRDLVGCVCIQCPRADPPCARVSISPRSHVRAGDFLFPKTTKKTPLTLANQGLIGIRQRLILPGRVQPSTFSTGELNFCVRDGNR